MPHLTLPVSQGGPFIDLFVAVSIPRGVALQKANQASPAPVRARALIDTGASCTAIDPSIIQPLGLSPTGSVALHTPSTAGVPHTCNQYDVALILPFAQGGKIFEVVQVTETQLAPQGFQILLGRDVLASCLFIYDGQAMQFQLAF